MGYIEAPRKTETPRLLFPIQLWLGLDGGPIVGSVNRTGAIVVFRYELNRMTRPGTAYVTPRATRLTLDEMAATLQASHPADKLRTVGWGDAGPDTAWN